MQLTPHGPGFTFIDSIAVFEAEKRVVAQHWLDPQAPYFAHHFPGHPLMPGVFMIEAAAQAAGALWSRLRQAEHKDPMFLAQVGPFRYRQPVLPGTTLEIDVRCERDFGALAKFQATLRVEGQEVSSGVLTLARKPAAA